MPRRCRMSSASANRSASIQRNFGTRPRAKLQKSQAALQEFVTAMLHSPGPPLRTMRSTSQAFAIVLDTFLSRRADPLLPQHCPQFDSAKGSRFVPEGLVGAAIHKPEEPTFLGAVRRGGRSTVTLQN